MIRLKDVNAALDEAERHFETCWSYLVSIKRGQFKRDRVAPLVEFQPLLASALFGLATMHNSLAKERQERIDSKANYSRAWFARRMAFLARQQRRIVEAVRLGQSIGDAYAWFFYQNEQDFLRQHALEPRGGVMSTGIGGIGELQFAKNVRMMGPHLVLHHCVTGMLRLGDVTLIDLNGFKVVGIGELKSHSDRPGHVTISLSVLGSLPAPNLNGPADDGTVAAAQPDLISRLSHAAKARLERQMDRIRSSHTVAKKAPDSTIAIESEDRMQSFNTLLAKATKSRVSTVRAGKGLTLLAYRLPTAPLSKRLGRSSGSRLPRGLVRGIANIAGKVQETMVPGRQDNALFIDSLYYGSNGAFDYLPGMTHPFWWPVDPDALKPLVFKQLVVCSMYNPAWLFKELEATGFAVDTSNPREPQITRTFGDMQLKCEGIPFYFSAIQRYLMDEQAVANMLARVAEAAGTDSEPKRIDLLFSQKFGRPDSAA